MPEHTQYALFQLYCDLRANPIKDRHWLEVHARRLRPHTFPGWIVSPPHCPTPCLLHALVYLADMFIRGNVKTLQASDHWHACSQGVS